MAARDAHTHPYCLGTHANERGSWDEDGRVPKGDAQQRTTFLKLGRGLGVKDHARLGDQTGLEHVYVTALPYTNKYHLIRHFQYELHVSWCSSLFLFNPVSH